MRSSMYVAKPTAPTRVARRTRARVCFSVVMVLPAISAALCAWESLARHAMGKRGRPQCLTSGLQNPSQLPILAASSQPEELPESDLKRPAQIQVSWRAPLHCPSPTFPEAAAFAAGFDYSKAMIDGRVAGIDVSKL